MTNEEFQQLKKLYEVFCAVKTNGEDTVLMGKALEAFKIFLKQSAAVGLESVEANAADEEEKE